ncbi:MAG: hypothetical protein JNL08_19105 [Planctomycetes bacterium]|nr:hypothetical protein [Planctomycetota bacterium]
MQCPRPTWRAAASFRLVVAAALPLPAQCSNPWLPGDPVPGVLGRNCDALVVPDILGVLRTTTGTAQSSWFLHNTPSLVGVAIFHQMVPIEFDALGNWVAVTGTNALQLTAGAC